MDVRRTLTDSQEALDALAEEIDLFKRTYVDEQPTLAAMLLAREAIEALQAEVEAVRQVSTLRFRQLDCLTNGNAEQGCGHVH